MATVTSLAADERSARMVLATAVEPGDPFSGRVLRSVGAVETVRLVVDGGALPGVGSVESALWRQRVAAALNERAATKVLEDTADQGLRTVIPEDWQWPRGFDDLGDRAPIVLWCRGDIGLLRTERSRMVTMTGSRASTAYGETVGSELSADLSRRGCVLVAGGGYGIDQAVHTAALAANGKTIAVLASGLDHPYPSGNQPLFQRIGDSGLLVSELPSGAVPTRTRFLQRHRILAALSGATVLVEAAPRSGALNTARQAIALGRPVGAVPGPVTNATSIGTNGLLRHATASVVVDAQDIADLLEPPASGSPRSESLHDGIERRRQGPQRVL